MLTVVKNILSFMSGIRRLSVAPGQVRDLKKGWYHFKGSASALESPVSVVVTEQTNNMVLLDSTGDWLPNLRYRTYFFTSGGRLQTDGFDSAELQQFPAWQVRLRTGLRQWRRNGVFSGISTIFASHSTVIDIHHRSSATRNVLESLAEFNQSQLTANLVVMEASESQSLKQMGEAELASTYVIVAFSGDIKLHEKSRAVLDFHAKKFNFPPIMYSQHCDTHGHCMVKPEFDAVYYAVYDFIGPALFIRADQYSIWIGDTILSSGASLYKLVSGLISDQVAPVRIDEFIVRSARPETDLSQITTHYQSLSTCRDDSGVIRRWQYQLDTVPKVSVIIPTYNGLAVLRPCIETLLRTNYEELEIIVVDNNSDDAEALAYLNSLPERGITVIRYPYPFNYSAINNFAVSKSSGDYLCLLNNDVEIIDQDWLKKMMCWAVMPGTGAVGARLLYGNGRIQHAGVVVGMGNAAGHLHRLEPDEQSHHRYRISSVQQVCAVTAACLVVKKSAFLNVGGLDETGLAVAYNDIDLCLKLNKTGLQTVYCADAVLYHHESVSRGDDLSSEKIKRYTRELKVFQKRWRARGFTDRVMSKHWNQHHERVPRLTLSGNDAVKHFQ